MKVYPSAQGLKCVRENYNNSSQVVVIPTAVSERALSSARE
jgi:hypothetical protein